MLVLDLQNANTHVLLFPYKAFTATLAAESFSGPYNRATKSNGQ